MTWGRSPSIFHRAKLKPARVMQNEPGINGGSEKSPELPKDAWLERFLQHLATDKAASIYTQRNYRQALFEFHGWDKKERENPPAWKDLQRDDFRSYLRFLGRHNLGRAAIQLRFSALRTFYKFLIRHVVLAASPIKNLSLP